MQRRASTLWALAPPMGGGFADADRHSVTIFLGLGAKLSKEISPDNLNSPTFSLILLRHQSAEAVHPEPKHCVCSPSLFVITVYCF